MEHRKVPKQSPESSKQHRLRALCIEMDLVRDRLDATYEADEVQEQRRLVAELQRLAALIDEESRSPD